MNKFKKPVSILLTLLLLLSVTAVPILVNATDYEITVANTDYFVPEDDRFYGQIDYRGDNDWGFYTNQDHLAVIQKCKSTSSTVTFPAQITIDDTIYYVKTLGGVYDECYDNGYWCEQGMFYYDWDDNGSNLTTAIIENGIDKIGWLAFANCENLTEVRIPESVKYIGPSAFENIGENAHIYFNSTEMTFCDSWAYSADDGNDPWWSEAANGVFGNDIKGKITLHGPVDSEGKSEVYDYATLHPGVVEFEEWNPLDTPYGLDDEAIRASGAATADGNPFDLPDDLEYTQGTLLGVQRKTSTNGLRFIAEISSGLLADPTVTDYGFEIAKASTTTTAAFVAANGFDAMDTAIGNLGDATSSSRIVKASCRNGHNNIVRGYGNEEGEGDTAYKYVTLAIENIAGNYDGGFAVRFYVTINGTTWYANYTDGDDVTYRGLCTDYSSVTA